tara:strand:- start:3747 stop:4976 length:1230 start_codon:yes stop_codon:yes gene_type:complete
LKILLKDYIKNYKMHNFTLRIILITSILWGIGYPNLFRIPLYVFVITGSLILSNLLRIDNIRNIFTSLNLYKSFKPKRIYYFWFLLLLIYLFIWKTFSLFYLLIILSFILIGSYFLKTETIISKNWFYNSLVISISLAAICVPIVGPFNQYVSASPSIFPEPSNLGFTLGPVLGLLTFKKGYRFFGIFGIIFFHFFCFSRSLWIGYLFSGLISKKFNSKLSSLILASGIILAIFISVTILFLYAARIEYIFPINNKIIQYPSILIWYNWLKFSLINIAQYPLGMGPFGWIELLNNSNTISLCQGEALCKINGSIITILNKRDLASFISFGLASFGILFPIFLFSFLNFLCKFKIVISKFYFRLDPLSILIISYIFTFMFRWTGLTAGPLLGLLFLLLGLQSKKKISLLE